MKTAREFYLEQDLGYIEDYMIEFAKMHVQEALKEAVEKAKIKYEYSGNTGSEYCDEYVDHNSILNAYPLTNIK
jgi:hypothetical protein